MAEANAYRIVVMSTDPDWFRFVRARPYLKELNFWRPSARVDRTARGTPWLFQIRSTNEIRGMGIFSAFGAMPIGVAWDTFGEANGVPDLESFRRKIARLQGVAESQVREIGCAVLSSPQYFEVPLDFRQFGRMYGPVKSFDTRTAEGAHLRTQIGASIRSNTDLSPIVLGGKGRPTLVVPRIGQGAFRIELEKQYQMRCAVTGEKTRPALEAAHIKPFALVGEHRLSNGLLLRSDIHKLFDKGYVTVDTSRIFRVSKAIRDEFENGRDYYALDGIELRETVSPEATPSREYLEWHSDTVFRR